MIREHTDAANESFRVLAELIPQLVYIYDASGTPLYLNGRFLSYTGLTLADARKSDRWDLIHRGEREAARAAWRHSLESGEPFEQELRVRGRHGTYRWFISRARTLRAADGSIERWYGTLTDIEDQKRTEETLIQLTDAGNRLAATLGAEATLKALAETSVQALADWCTIYTYDENGELGIAQISHKDPSRVNLARELLQRYPMQQGDAAGQVALTGESMLYTDITDDMLRASAANDEHYRMLRELGLFSAMIVPLRARGQRLGAMSLISAESARRYTELDLRLASALAQRAALAYDATRLIADLTRSEHEMRQMIEILPQMVWVSDPVTGSIEFANHRWLEYFGIDEEQNRRWIIREYVHPDDAPDAAARWKASLQAGQPYEIEYRLRKYDGSYHWFLARGIPVRDASGRITKWFGSATDVDAQKLEHERTQLVADTLQQAFIPRILPQKPHVRFDAAYIPAENLAVVGGDWYDAFELDDGTIVFSIGDVAGHGLEAAVSMGNIRQAIFGAGVDCENPQQVLDKVNRLICLQHSNIATAIVGFIRGAEIAYCSAGHPPAVIADDRGAQFLPHGGMPLGVDRDARFGLHRVQARPGTLIVLYTDGLTEARRRIDEDEARLLAAAAYAARNGTTAAQIRRAVLGSIPSPDDTAIMTLRF